MNYINLREFAFCNIPTWHEKGFTGKGVRIGVIEGGVIEDWPGFEGHVFDPLKIGHNDKLDADSHSYNTIDIIRQIAPEADIYVLPSSYNYEDLDNPRNILASFKWLIENDIELVSFSMTGSYEENEVALYEKAFHEGTLLIAAAGNSSDNGLTPFATNDHWFSIGACHMIKNEPERGWYSSIGPELDIMGFSNLNIHDQKEAGRIYKQQGTSFSCPFIAGMFALYYEAFKAGIGRFPTPDEARRFALKNCKDLREAGFDIQTGNGIFIFPTDYTNTEISMKIGSMNYTVNGADRTMDVAPMLYPPDDNNARTFVPIRFIAEELGCKVDWDETTRGVIITKDDMEIKMFIDNNIYYVNGVEKTMNVTPILYPADSSDARTFVPVRFIAEELGCMVEWVSETNGILIKNTSLLYL